MPRFARLASGFIVGTIILHLLWRALKGLGAAAIEDWVDQQIAQKFDLVSPTQKQVLDFVLSWTIPAIFLVAVYLAFRAGQWWEYSRASKPDTTPPTPIKLEADIGASDAFFMILADSVWKRQQQATMIVTKSTRPDWLSFRLNKEVHNALRNEKICAWGEECLVGMVTTAVQPIPSDVWNKAELDFKSDPRFPRTSACLKGSVTWELGRSVWTDVRFSRQQFFCQFPLVSVTSKRDLAQQLDNLYATGVGERNRLMPTIAEFDLDKEKMTFTHWDNRVLTLLDSSFVSVADKSAFRTLNLFQPASADAPNKTAEQRHIEAMWTEKLSHLKTIIDRVGR
jgi:hypothetical protein